MFRMRFLLSAFVVTLLSLSCLAFPALAADSVGTVIFAIGETSSQLPGAKEQSLQRGDQLQAGVQILTGANGHVHIKLVDGGFVSIRPSSRFRIEEYKYDAKDPKNNRVRFSLEQGTARSITGKAGESNKASYRLNTPLAAIGIRGTDFVVHADKDFTRAMVQSGAIVMAPFGTGCEAEQTGPCKTNVARVLTDSMKENYLELKGKGNAPGLVPMEKPLSLQLLFAPPRPEEPVIEKSKGNRPSASQSPSQGADAGALAGPPKPNAGTSPVATPGAPPAPSDTVVGPVAPPPVNAAVPQRVWWGRWQVTGQEGKTVASLLDPQREVTVGNALFGLLREKGTVELPSSGSFKFRLADSEAYLMGQDKSLAPANLSAASLTVDFANLRFDTYLAVSAKGNLNSEIRASGQINAQGFLVSEFTSPDSAVAGALSKNGDQVGYLFQRNINGGWTFIGATRWVK